MDKIFSCLHKWSIPFTYNGFHSSNEVLVATDVIDGIMFDIKIIKSENSNGIDLLLDNNIVEIKDNSAFYRNLIKRLDVYFSDKTKEMIKKQI